LAVYSAGFSLKAETSFAAEIDEFAVIVCFKPGLRIDGLTLNGANGVADLLGVGYRLILPDEVGLLDRLGRRFAATVSASAPATATRAATAPASPATASVDHLRE